MDRLYTGLGYLAGLIWRQRPTAAGFVALGWLFVNVASASAAGVVLPHGTCDQTQTLCLDLNAPNTMLTKAETILGVAFTAIGVIAALFGLRHWLGGKGMGKGTAEVVGGILVAIIAGNIAAGGVQKWAAGQ